VQSIIVTEQGCRLSRDGGRLIIKKEGRVIFTRPLIRVSHLILMGRMEISHGMVAHALSKGIRVSWLTRGGRYRGHLAAPVTANIPVRLKQWELLNNPAQRVRLGRAMIAGKINNYARLIYKRSPVVYEAFEQRLRNARASVAACETLPALRGLEGSFSALYFRNLPSLLLEDFGFRKRIKHPPPDPLNILLSLVYTALFHSVHGFVEAAGLDPYCGVVHEVSYGHPALVSDLMEEFRAPLGDALVMALINRRRINATHFTQEGERTRLTREGLEIVMDAYRQRLDKKIRHEGRQFSYTHVIERQVWRYMRVLEGKETDYVPFIYR